MTRTCVDSTNAVDLPRTAAMALAYVDGLYGTDKTASPVAVARQCPHAKVVSVTVQGHRAPMCDCEQGDLTPDSAARWALEQLHADGKSHTIYFPIALHDQVAAACRKIGLVPGKTVFFFGAHYTGQARIEPGYIGIQYEDPHFSKHHYDVSIVVDHWPGVDPPPKKKFARLQRGPKSQARQLIRELRRQKLPVHPKDRPLLQQLLAVIARLLSRRAK